MAVIREDALQDALISVLIASENQGVNLEQLITRALSMTADYPHDSSGVGAVPTRASIELQNAYRAVLLGRRTISKEA
ncbi:hypothetical protein FCH79_13910 [Pseudomonas koreensis]|uniref:hypothetical protein n=1 Tax=Pseudomonas TaxID=286 RepID=UPI000597651D|nr:MULTISPECIES: hypothetical protein [Pseudomonas]KIK84713.1 hypothetical protein OC71_19750 [Pseudomonas sp. W15Feb9B]NTZ96403.1 hypothetical protein [Pseudomonas koreensis]